MTPARRVFFGKLPETPSYNTAQYDYALRDAMKSGIQALPTRRPDKRKAEEPSLGGNRPAAETPYFNRFKLVDLASRVIPSAFFLLIVLPKFGELYSLLTTHRGWRNDPETWQVLTDLIYTSSTVCFLTLMGVLFLIRLEPIEKASRILPRLTAITGTFLMAVVTFFPRTTPSMAQMMAASLISLVGTGLSAFALAHLGRSFSLMAEARRLVTTGPYNVVRHPLYLFEGMSTFGVLLQHLSPYTVLIFIAHILIQLTRMKNEEAVLQKVFPEYEAYKLRTARVIPGIY